MKIFREDVTAAIRTFRELGEANFQSSEPTIQFLEIFKKLFNINDISSTTEYLRKRLDDKMPFYSIDDERLTWLNDEFLPW